MDYYSIQACKFKEGEMSSESEMPHKTVDASGLHCPQPILRCMAALASLCHGDILHLITTDPDSIREIDLFIANTEHALLKIVKQGHVNHFYIEKNLAEKSGKVFPSVLAYDLLSGFLIPGAVSG